MPQYPPPQPGQANARDFKGREGRLREAVREHCAKKSGKQNTGGVSKQQTFSVPSHPSDGPRMSGTFQGSDNGSQNPIDKPIHPKKSASASPAQASNGKYDVDECNARTSSSDQAKAVCEGLSADHIVELIKENATAGLDMERSHTAVILHFNGARSNALDATLLKYTKPHDPKPLTRCVPGKTVLAALQNLLLEVMKTQNVAIGKQAVDS